MERVTGIEELSPPPAKPAKAADRAWGERIRALIRAPLTLDVVLAVGLAVAGIVEAWPGRFFAPLFWDEVIPDVLRMFALALGVSLPLLLRRRYPTAVMVAIMVAVVLGASNLTIGPIAFIFALFSLGLYEKDRGRSLATLATVLGGFIVVFGITTDPDELAWNGFAVAMITAIWLTGDALRGRTARADLMERRAEELERQRADDLAKATAAERARIARELHDVIAHNLSVVVIQAGAALKVQDEQPEAAREALRQVEATGRQAMTEMRRLLGVLRKGDEDESLTTPQPGLAALPDLLEEIGAAGLNVSLKEVGERRELPPGVDVSVYRIVQEALTNVLRHANATQATVEIRYLPSSVEVAVTDNGTSKPMPSDEATGHGLAGMRERAELFEGTFEAGPMPEGGFAVRVSLPTDARAS